MQSTSVKSPKQPEKDDSNVATQCLIYGVDASSSNWSISLFAIPKWASRELEDNRRLLPSFEGEHLVQARATYLPKPLGGSPFVPHIVG